MSLSSRRIFAIWSRMRRRSISIFVSPAPRVPMPPACRDIASPQPRRRGSRYCNCASVTCALPSFERACWAKMSRINHVRSTTFTFSRSSRVRNCDGVRSPSQITVSARFATTASRSSITLPEPMNVDGSGASRRCTSASSTLDPAVSARRASSVIERSTSSADPSVQTPTSTTRSRRTCRYSASLMSSSSVERPSTRRSAWRSESSKSPMEVVSTSRSS